MKVTESKTINGTIIEVGQSAPRSTCWGEFLFRGREVKVRVIGNSPPIITMYVREDSWISQMKISIEAFTNQTLCLTVHGEAYKDADGIIIIDKMIPESKTITCINLDKFFDFD